MKLSKPFILTTAALLLLCFAFATPDQVLAQEEFTRGDANGDCLISFFDAAAIMDYLYGGAELTCMDAGDVSDDGIVTVVDPVYLINYLFKDGPEPLAPFPTPGTDPTPDGLDCLLECVPIDPDPSLLDSLIAGDASGAQGETEIVVPIIAVNSQNLLGYQIFLDYDENILEATAVETTGTATGAANPNFFSYDMNVSAGEIEIVCAVDLSGKAGIPAGRETLVEIKFSVKMDAPVGATTLDLINVTGVPFKGNLFTYDGERLFPTLGDGDFTVIQVDFTRGDADGDCLVSNYDLAYLAGYLYGGGPVLPCMDADDGIVNSEDITYLLNYLFKSGPPPPAPFPAPGTDPTPDELTCIEECVPINLEPSLLDSLIAGDASGSCGETGVAVALTVVNSQDLFGYQILLDYDENVLEAIAVDTTGTATGAADVDYLSYDLNVLEGRVEIVCLVDYSGVASIPAGRETLVKIMFSVKPDVFPGTSILDLNNVMGVPFKGNLFTYEEGKLSPTLIDGNFTVEPTPAIISITDVGNDQGRQVRVNWDRSCYDAVGSPVTITEYSIWRRIDGDKAHSQSYLGMLEPGRLYPPGDWDFIKTVPARGEEEYNAVCPTLGDFTEEEGIYWSVFFVSAMTSDPLVYYDSEPDSGYSVDNIPPLPIEDLEIDPDSWFTLAWTVPGEYQGEQPIFSYDIRYSTEPVGTDPQAWWNNAQACSGEGFFNLMVGEEDSLKAAMETYCHPEIYLAIRGLDERPNASEISNVVHYLCGDVTDDGIVNVGDVVYQVGYLYRNGPAPAPVATGDVNCDGIVNVGDIIYLVSYLYRNGPSPGNP